MTDDQIAAIFWRETTKGTSDPFCWNGYTMMCYQVLAGVFVKGYRAAHETLRTHYILKPIGERPACCIPGGNPNCCGSGCAQDEDILRAQASWAAVLSQ